MEYTAFRAFCQAQRVERPQAPDFTREELSEERGAKAMKPTLRKAKMQAATNLDEMLLLAENGEWQKT